MADLLIVDDDRDIAGLLADLLGALGHRVRIAHDGREGLRRVLERAPDLVLLDVEMPVLTGPEMAYGLFLHDLGQEDIPVILLSGVVNLEQVAAGVGTTYFLAKPYDLQALEAVVDRALRERLAPVRTGASSPDPWVPGEPR